MIFNLFRKRRNENHLISSELHDETTFYSKFIKDLEKVKKEVIIESPYITCKRMQLLEPIFRRLIKRGVKVYIITRHPQEHTESLASQADFEIYNFETMGVHVLLCAGNHHRKLAMLDRKVLWEGSLNILSQGYSREIMRRIDSEVVSMQMFRFLQLQKVL